MSPEGLQLGHQSVVLPKAGERVARFHSHHSHCITDHLTGTLLRVDEGAMNSHTGPTGGSRDHPRQTVMYGHATTTYASMMFFSTSLSTSWHSFSLELIYNPNCGYRNLRHLLKLTSHVTFWMSSLPPWNHFTRTFLEIRILFRLAILINFELSHSCHQTVRSLRAGTMFFLRFVSPLVTCTMSCTYSRHLQKAYELSRVCQHQVSYGFSVLNKYLASPCIS